MNRFPLTLLALALCGTVLAQTAVVPGMSREAYQAQKDRIEADAKAARAKCDPLQGNAKDICKAEAKAAEKVSKAELEAQYKPSPRNEEKLRDARADAAYDVAKERCDEQQGKAKDACVQQAKSARTSAKAQAKAIKASEDAALPGSARKAPAGTGAASGVTATPAVPATRP